MICICNSLPPLMTTILRELFFIMSSHSARPHHVPRWVRPLHTYSSMLMLMVMLFFTLTGLTLNNRQWLPAPSPLIQQQLSLPPLWAETGLWQQDPLLAGTQLFHWLRQQHGLEGGEMVMEWNAEEQLLTLDIKRPGGYSLVEIEPALAEVRIETQPSGVLAVLNDLHMGRYSGEMWRWFIDLSSLVMLLFTLTGFWLVLSRRNRRTSLFGLSVTGAALMGALYFVILYY